MFVRSSHKTDVEVVSYFDTYPRTPQIFMYKTAGSGRYKCNRFSLKHYEQLAILIS